MQNKTNNDRRRFLKTAAGVGTAAFGTLAGAQAFDFKPSQRYPDPAVLILDPSFAKYRLYSSTLEQLGSGMRWAEGPVYFPEHGYLLLSDIPNNRLMKYDEKTGKFSVHKTGVNYANGNTRDRQGRLVTCEHSVTRRVVRTEKDGRITVLADNYQGKRLNAPNDIVVKSDDTVWFTDPLFGINGEWEGSKAASEQATTNVYRIATDGKLTAVITDLVNPNGIAFSPDEKILYVADSGYSHGEDLPRHIRAFDVNADNTVRNGRVYCTTDNGLPDGFRLDDRGNVWTSAWDGVHCFNPDGVLLGKILTPKAVANVEFGGPRRNRLFICATDTLHSIYLAVNGATRP